MPNPLSLSDASDLTNKSVKRIHIKTMLHGSEHKSMTKAQGKVHKVMTEFKKGMLHSGSKKGPKVTSRKQGIAIALSEARKAGANVPKKKGLPIIKGRYSS